MTLQQITKIEEPQEPHGSRTLKKKVPQRGRDEQGRFVKAHAKEQFSIDQPGRQLARDSRQQDLAESPRELATEVTLTPGGFPWSPQKGLPSKA